MATWTSHFEAQRKEFATERHQQYEKAAGNVKLYWTRVIPTTPSMAPLARTSWPRTRKPSEASRGSTSS